MYFTLKIRHVHPAYGLQRLRSDVIGVAWRGALNRSPKPLFQYPRVFCDSIYTFNIYLVNQRNTHHCCCRVLKMTGLSALINIIGPARHTWNPSGIKLWWLQWWLCSSLNPLMIKEYKEIWLYGAPFMTDGVMSANNIHCSRVHDAHTPSSEQAQTSWSTL